MQNSRRRLGVRKRSTAPWGSPKKTKNPVISCQELGPLSLYACQVRDTLMVGEGISRGSRSNNVRSVLGGSRGGAPDAEAHLVPHTTVTAFQHRSLLLTCLTFHSPFTHLHSLTLTHDARSA